MQCYCNKVQTSPEQLSWLDVFSRALLCFFDFIEEEMLCFMWKKKTTTKVTRLYKTHSSSAAPHQFPSLSCTWTVFLLFLSLLMCRRSIHGLHCILFAIKFWCFDHRIDNKHILDSVSFFEIQMYLNALTVFKYLALTFHTVHVDKCWNLEFTFTCKHISQNSNFVS